MDVDKHVLDICLKVTRQEVDSATTQTEANIFRAASKIIFACCPIESQNLRLASDAYFDKNPDEMVSILEVVHRGWIQNLPRLQTMLRESFQHHTQMDA